MTKETNPQVSELMRPAHAALVLGIHTKTLSRMALAGSIKSVVLPSGHRRYVKSDIETLRGVA
jgi:predicted site-specific integrase-resolvase